VTAEPAVDPIEPVLIDHKADNRGSPIPSVALVATRFMELRRRRGLIAALTVVTIGIPTVFLAARLLLHAIAPKTYGPAGGYDIYTGLSAGVLYVFGFIVAAALGCTAGSDDLSDGVFRHLVITGRSRVALYLARIPAVAKGITELGYPLYFLNLLGAFKILGAVAIFTAVNHVCLREI